MTLDDLPLFAPPLRDEPLERERVSARIGHAIVAFCRARVGQTFHADELRAAVEAACGRTAPGSADRILRQLRAGGVIAYRVIDRRRSLYLIEGA